MNKKSSNIRRVVLPIEIFDDPNSPDAVMLTRPNPPADKVGENVGKATLAADGRSANWGRKRPK